MYDISDLDSFEAVDNWIKSIREIGKEKLPIVLVGNKCDLSDDERKISLKEGQDKANEFQRIKVKKRMIDFRWLVII